MTETLFWVMVAIWLLAIIGMRVLWPRAGRWFKRPMSRVVLEFIGDRERNSWLFLWSFWAGGVLWPAVNYVTYAFVSFLALREFLTRTPANAADYKSLFVAFFVLIPLQYIFVGMGWYAMFSIFIPVLAFFLLPSLSALSGDTQEFFTRAAKLQLGVMLCIYCLSHIPATLNFSAAAVQGHPVYLMFFLFAVTQVGDIVQYSVARASRGGHRVARSITRDMTWEGVGWGLLAAIGVGLTMYPLVGFNLITNVGVAAATAGAGFLASLVLDGIRISTGIRDWGEPIEGRTSLLDRLASLVFAAPVFYHLCRFTFGV